ncbi:MAG: N-succinylarginine dihydrolase, partial [Myxococcales bacterium]
VFFFHEHAFLSQDKLKLELETKSGADLHFIEVAERDIPLKEAVASYLFNSQLVTLPTGGMALIVPRECRVATRVWDYVEKLPTVHPVIERIEVVDVRQSMRNGGGPACLRLRVVLTDEEIDSISSSTLLDENLFERLNAWVDRHYREHLTEADLGDPLLLAESRTALDELTQLLKLGSIYSFQRVEGGHG